MLQLKTAQGFTLPINWIGVSDFDGSLRFETPETDLAMLFFRLQRSQTHVRPDPHLR